MSSEHRKCLASFSVSVIGGRCAPFGRKDGWIFLSRLDFASKPIIEENVPPKSFRITLSVNLNSTAVQLCPVIRICTEIPFSRRPMPLLQCQYWQHRYSSSGSTSILSLFAREGGSVCGRCQAHNFGFRMLCFECQSPITDGRIFYTKGQLALSNL